MFEFPPEDLPRLRAVHSSPWEFQPFLAVALYRRRRRAGAAKRPEEDLQTLLHLRIGVEHRTARRVVDEADRQAALQCAALCLVQHTSQQARAERMKFG